MDHLSTVTHPLLTHLIHHLPKKDDNRGDACVLVAITNETNPKLLLSKRSNRLSSHAGEIAFVGGRKDGSDLNDGHTALREASEEVGLDSAYCHIIGYLPPQLSKRGLVVMPVVALLDPQAPLTVCADEVDKILWVSLKHFFTAPKPVQLHLAHYRPKPFTVHAWMADHEPIWGLTARIIEDLICHLS